MSAAIVRRAFTVHDYRKMLQSGILAEDDRVELIAGEVRYLTPITPRHAALVNRMNAVLSRLVGDSAIVSVQNPIQLDDYTEPQPDLALLAPHPDFYSTALPLLSDVLLVIEVADTSLDYDRDEKLPRYAASGVAEVWIVDVAAQSVEQHSQPRADLYRTKRTHELDEAITSASLPQLTVRVAQIFG